MSYHYITSVTAIDLAHTYKTQMEHEQQINNKISNLHENPDLRIRQLIHITDSNNLAKQAYLKALAKIEHENAMIMEEMKRMTGMPNSSPLPSLPLRYNNNNNEQIEYERDNDSEQESGFYEDE